LKICAGKKMDFTRYSRQIILEELGEAGQKLLSQKHAVIIGGGGLGSNSSEILTRLGIGHIDIVDDDKIDITNLHRTSLFNEEDIGQHKTTILEKKLQKINSEVTINGINQHVTKDNIESFTKNADIILDGTDSMQTRFLLNETAVKHNIFWVYAGVYATVGMVMGIQPAITPCLKCISQNISHKTDTIPVLGNLPLTIASIQCIEALKLLLGNHTPGLIIYDIWKQQFEQISIQKNPNCTCCTRKQFKLL
jgi:adenylyltransferase/sulfurtransferase